MIKINKLLLYTGVDDINYKTTVNMYMNFGVIKFLLLEISVVLIHNYKTNNICVLS